MYPRSMAESDCIVVMGSNMAECHPVAFRWPMQAKVNGATLIHVDPRFTRTSAMANIYAPIRSGSDIAFLGGIINYVVNSDRWRRDPFFRTWVVHYTNAATIVGDRYRDAEDNAGVFSGLMQYKGGVAEWPYNGFVGEYDGASWQYARTRIGDQGRVAATAQSGETTGVQSGTRPPDTRAPGGPPYDALVRSLLQPPPERNDTLQNPRCVFQVVTRHFSRYTPEMVERVTGCPKETFVKVARTRPPSRTRSPGPSTRTVLRRSGARLERAAMRRLEWLVVKDNWVHETATFWKNAPEVTSGGVKPQDVKTEVFFFPSSQVAETEGTFTNTQRLLQTHFKAAEAPGDCRTDVWFTYQLGKRLKALGGGA